MDERSSRLNARVVDRRAAGWVIVTLNALTAEMDSSDGSERLSISIGPDGSISERHYIQDGNPSGNDRFGVKQAQGAPHRSIPYTERYTPPSSRFNWKSTKVRVVGGVILALAVLYGFGALDVFLASNGLPTPSHQCLQYGTVFHMDWYCNGPLSTNPFTPAVQAAFDACMNNSGSGNGFYKHC